MGGTSVASSPVSAGISVAGDRSDGSGVAPAVGERLSSASASTYSGAPCTSPLTAIENLIGSNYNDSLTGNTLANTLTGGLGNDVLNGGYGETTFFFGKNNGKDTIVSNSASDKVVLYDVTLDDIAKAKIGTISEGSDFTVKLNDKSNSQFTIKNFSSGTANTFQLGDGSTWSYDFDNKNWKAAE